MRCILEVGRSTFCRLWCVLERVVREGARRGRMTLWGWIIGVIIGSRGSGGEDGYGGGGLGKKRGLEHVWGRGRVRIFV
jgi:hypothetical protein